MFARMLLPWSLLFYWYVIGSLNNTYAYRFVRCSEKCRKTSTVSLYVILIFPTRSYISIFRMLKRNYPCTILFVLYVCRRVTILQINLKIWPSMFWRLIFFLSDHLVIILNEYYKLKNRETPYPTGVSSLRHVYNSFLSYLVLIILTNVVFLANDWNN